MSRHPTKQQMLRMLELDESSIAARLRAVRKRIKSMKRKTALIAAIAAISLTGCAWLKSHESQIADTAGVLAIRAADSASSGQLNADDMDGLAAGIRSELLSIRTATDLLKIGKIWLKHPSRSRLHATSRRAGHAHIPKMSLCRKRSRSQSQPCYSSRWC